jgi:aspartate-semialdehyde dehydrogenase
MPAARAWGLKVGVVEPTSLVGRDVRAVLVERRLPVEKLELFHASPDREGLLTAGDEEELEFVAPLEPDSLDGCQVAFLCGGGEALARFLAARADGCLAIDVSGLRSGGPFVLPHEDSGELLPPGNLFLTRDPTAYVLWKALRILGGLGALSGVTAAVDRPVSELGRAAIDELFQQSIALASFKGMPKEILPAQSAFNFYHPVDSESYEERVREDVTRLLREEVPVSVLSARAGVFHGHHIRLEARYSGDAPEVAEVSEALFETGTGFAEPDAESPEGPVESAGRDETLVLRVSASEGSVRLALASDHLRRGGAHLAVRVAEEAVRERGLLADA